MSTTAKKPKAVEALVNYFGRDGEVQDHVAAELAGCRWIGVGFAGGLGILDKFKCNQGIATDLHHHVMNLAAVVRDPVLREQFLDALAWMPCNEAIYHAAQQRCRMREHAQGVHVQQGVELFEEYPAAEPTTFRPPCTPDVAWAVDYFIVSWMGQGGRAGTKDEFESDSFSFRWTASGGSSSSRWRSAVANVEAVGDVYKRWTFVCMDAFELIDTYYKNVEAKGGGKGSGLYFDPPFHRVGDPYKHRFTERLQRQLATSVMRFKDTRVVMRFQECDLVRQLYPTSHWTYTELQSRSQGNNPRTELILTNGPSRVAGQN